MPGAFLQDQGGAIELQSKVTRLSFRLYLLDLVNVSDETKKNELEVQSDMLSVADDLLAEFDHSKYDDWAISPSNVIVLLEEEFDALTGGIYVDFDVRIQYTKDTCAIPWKS